VIDIRADGSFRLDMRFFNYAHGLAMTGRRLERLLGFPRRRPEGPFSALYMDLAASVQEVAEDALLAMAGHVRRQTGMPHLCLAGGVALNCVANARLRDSGLFKDIWIQPASGDAGNALGAALAAWHLHFHKSRQVRRPDSQTGSLLGPAYNDAAIRSAIAALGLRAHVLPAAAVPNKAAALLADGKVLGWFQGRMEYGPRALGCRSILGDPRDTDMQTRMNLKIKFRESFRPFAPAVLEEKAAEWFETSVPSPYMLLTARVRNPLNRKKNAALAGFDKLAVKRSRLPAVTHVDYSARLQTVSKKINPLFHALISAFAGLTGIPVVINTSFNVRGEPIVCTPADALRCFLGTGMDALLLGRFLLLKQEQDPEKIAAHSDLKEGYVLD
jgi:carbamoyltransferase